MKKTPSLRTSALWISIFLLIFILKPAKAYTDRIGGFYLDEGYHKSIFKFRSAYNLIIIPVVIDGRKLNLIFDTGMNSILIFEKKSIKSWKKRDKHIIHFSGLGRNNYIKGIRLDGITVNMPNIKGKGLSLVVTPSSTFPKVIDGIKIHGVFGYQLLSKFIVKIDYKNKLITLTDPHYFVPPLKASTIELNVFNTKPYINCFVIINQEKHYLNFLVDTGAEAPLILRKKSISIEKFKNRSKYLGVGLAGNLIGQKVVINDLELGTYHLSKDFEAWVPTQKSYPDGSSKIIRDGTIGGETLKQFTVTFDYFNSKLYLETDSPKTVLYKSKIAKK